MRLLISLAFALTVFAFGRAEAAPCEPASVQAAWGGAVSAYTAKNYDDAAKTIDGIIADCGTSPLIHYPRVMRAELALRANDPGLALTVLQPVPRPGAPPIGSYSSWYAMTAALAKKDMATFNAERDALLNAMDVALTDPASPAQGKLIERFEINGAKASAYKLNLKQGSFVRRYAIVVAVPDGLPISITSGPDLRAAEMMKQLSPGAPDVWFVDGYTCQSHATISQMEVKPNEDPSYETFKKAALKFVGDGKVQSSIAMDGKICAWPQFITPGLD